MPININKIYLIPFQNKTSTFLRGNFDKIFEISLTVEHFFRLGIFTASNPYKIIACCWLSVGLCSLGFLNFHQERDPLKLWVKNLIDLIF